MAHLGTPPAFNFWIGIIAFTLLVWAIISVYAKQHPESKLAKKWYGTT